MLLLVVIIPVIAKNAPANSKYHPHLNFICRVKNPAIDLNGIKLKLLCIFNWAAIYNNIASVKERKAHKRATGNCLNTTPTMPTTATSNTTIPKGLLRSYISQLVKPNGFNNGQYVAAISRMNPANDKNDFTGIYINN